LVAAGDLAGARTRYERSLAIAERLAQANPTSAAAQRDVLVSYRRMAQVTQDVAWWRKALSLAEELQRTGRLAPSDAGLLEFLRRQVQN
jgi:hypothetical protein